METKDLQMVDSFKNLTKNIVNFFENNLYEKHDISCSELSVLKVVYESEEEGKKINITELSTILKMTKSAASQLIAKLEKKSLVKRKINIFDKKINYITLTEEAKVGYEDNQKKYSEIVNKVIESMGEKDSKDLSRLLEKLSDIIKNLGEVA